MTWHSSSVILRTIILTVISTLQLFCVSRSAFAGTNEWTPLGPEQGRIALLTMDPTNPQILYASGENGGFKTTNGGASWTQAGLTGKWGMSLAVSGGNLFAELCHI